MGAQGAETNRQKKTRQRSARRGNASSLTSLRPVPYTLHSFTCSHVDGLWPRPLYVFIYECCYVGRNIYSPGLWDSHPCSAWSMRGNTKSKAERLLRAGGWVQLCSWVEMLARWGLAVLWRNMEPRIPSRTPGSTGFSLIGASRDLTECARAWRVSWKCYGWLCSPYAPWC